MILLMLAGFIIFLRKLYDLLKQSYYAISRCFTGANRQSRGNAGFWLAGCLLVCLSTDYIVHIFFRTWTSVNSSGHINYQNSTIFLSRLQNRLKQKLQLLRKASSTRTNIVFTVHHWVQEKQWNLLIQASLYDVVCFLVQLQKLHCIRAITNQPTWLISCATRKCNIEFQQMWWQWR